MTAQYVLKEAVENEKLIQMIKNNAGFLWLFPEWHLQNMRATIKLKGKKIREIVNEVSGQADQVAQEEKDIWTWQENQESHKMEKLHQLSLSTQHQNNDETSV